MPWATGASSPLDSGPARRSPPSPPGDAANTFTVSKARTLLAENDGEALTIPVTAQGESPHEPRAVRGRSHAHRSVCPEPEESASPSAQSRRFEPVDPDRFELDDLQPTGAPGRAGPTNVETGHLTFHGGKVLRSPDVVPVYVGAYWQTLQGKRERARNDAAMAALVKDPGQTGIWKQYGGGPGTTSPSKVLARRAA